MPLSCDCPICRDSELSEYKQHWHKLGLSRQERENEFQLLMIEREYQRRNKPETPMERLLREKAEEAFGRAFEELLEAGSTDGLLPALNGPRSS